MDANKKRNDILKDWHSEKFSIGKLAKKHNVNYTYVHAAIKQERFSQEFKRKFLLNEWGRI